MMSFGYLEQVILDVLANVKWTADGQTWLHTVWLKVKSLIQWQLRQAKQLGVMPALTNTYDEAPSMGLNGTNSVRPLCLYTA